MKIRRISVVLSLLVLLIAANDATAQVYYVTNDATATVGGGDAIVRMDYNGSVATTLASSITTSPSLLQIDYANNRAFVYEGYQTDPIPYPNNLAIKVINLNNGTVTKSIPLAVPGRAISIKYDPVNDFIYYITSDPLVGDAVNATANDALIRVKPDGTGSTTLASGFCKNPAFLALNIANNEIYVYQNLYADPRFYVFNLSGGAVRNFATTKPAAPYVGVDIAYDNVNDFIYYLTSDNSDATTSKDALKRIKPDGSGETVVAQSIGAGVVYAMTLDVGHNKAYFFDKATVASRGINSVDLTTGSVTLLKSISSPTLIPGIAVPLLPVISTAAVTTYTGTSATLGGNITRSDVSVTDRGVVYSSSNTTPIIGGNGVTQTANGSGINSFSANIGSLNASTTYYVRAYATSAAGTAYGAVQSFTTQSNDATLSGLTISAGTLNPSFSSGVISYAATVANANTSVTITPTRNNAGASIQVNNLAATSGSGSVVNLSIGDNAIPVKVTAPDGTTTKTYTITFTRPKASQTITFTSTATKTYGDADYAPGATSSSGLGVSYSSDNAAVATIVGGQVHIVGAGTANITASQGGDGNTNAATNVVQVLTVNAMPITITANTGQNKVYGNANPVYNYTVTTGAVKSGDAFNGALGRADGENVGSYAITQGNLTLSNNYTILFVGNNFSIGKRPLEITPTTQTKVYGNAEPASYTYQFTSGTSLASGDGMSGPFTRAAGENVGVYAFSIGAKHPVNINTGADQTGNYNITFVSANLTITKRPLTIAPIPVSKVYGQVDFATGAPYNLNGTSLASGDGMTGLFGRDNTSENVGVYALTLGAKHPVNISAGTDASSNYDISFVTNTFTITAKPVTVTANAQTKTYGDPDPALTYSNSGLEFSDSFTGALTRASGEGFGTYAITQGTLALSSNYTLTFNGSNLTIGKKIINVTANAQSVPYGAPIPTLTYTNDALVSGDSFTGELGGPAGNSVGTYPITQGTLALNSNYTLNFTGANLEITKKVINVTASAKNKIYGEADPEFTYSADALVGSDNFSGSLSRDAGEGFGTYAIKQGSLDLNGNYQINYTGANLTISKRDLDLYAVAKTVQYGDVDNTIGYYNTGTLADGDAFSGTLSREPGTAIGDYAITQNTLTVSNSANYNVTFHSAIYKITTRDINVSAAFKTKIYGDADPAITYNITSGSLLSGTEITGSLERDPGENTGPYAVKQGTLAIADPNYNLIYQGGSFEIDPAPLTIKVDNKTKLVNTPNPAFTYAITGFKNNDDESAFNSPIMFFNLPLSSAPVGTYDLYLADVSARNYTVTVQSGILTVREASSNANLAALSADNGGFTPAFDANTTDYEMTLPAGVSTVNITPTVADTNATVQVNYFDVASGQPLLQYVYPGDNLIPVVVTAEDHSTKQYTINVITPKSTDAKLSGIYFYGDGSTPSLSFDPDVHTYIVDVPNSTQYLRIIPISRASSGTLIKINGETYEGYFAPSFSPGANVYNIEVFAQDRTVSETYTLTINRALSSNNNLGSLQLSAGTLSPMFDTNIQNYTATVSKSVFNIDVTAYTADTTARFKVNGNTPVMYQPYNVALNPGDNTITVKVTAKNGDTKDYVVVVTKEKSTNSALSNLTINQGVLNPVFNSTTPAYTLAVGSGISSIKVTPTAVEAGEIIMVNGASVVSGNESGQIALNYGYNTINVIVTAEDLTTTQYTLVVDRETPLSNNAKISLVSNLSSVLTSTTGTSTYNYITSVSADVSSISLKATAQQANSVIKVNGAVVASGVFSDPITLNVGATVINLSVTAQDGVTVNTYSITVNRSGSNNSKVGLALTPASVLTKTTGTADVNYVTFVSSDINTVNIKANAQQADAVIKINGNIVTSGVFSDPIALNDGPTVINVAVTAQDGVTVSTYSITVNRTGSNNANALITLNPASVFTTITGTADINYTTAVSADVSSVTLKATTQQADAVVRVNGNVVTSGVFTDPIALNSGPTVINVSVTAEDGVTVNTYSVTVNRTGSNNAKISLATNSTSSLLGTTGTANYNYVISLSPGVNSISLKATAQQENAVIKVNGNVVTSGAFTDPIALNAGTSVINVSVTAQDGVTVNTYSVTVNHTGSNNIKAGFALNPASVLTRTTGSADVNYVTYVSTDVNSVNVKANATQEGSVIKVNGNIVTSGVFSAPIALNGNTTVINAEVTAQDGVTVGTYSITVNRARSNNANALITLNPASVLITTTGTADINYTTSVSADVNSVSLRAIAQQENAVIRVNGNVTASGAYTDPIALNNGPTVINVAVTAQDGVSVHTYSVTVNRTGSNNAKIGLATSSSSTLSATTGTANYNYVTSVSAGVSSISLKATAQQENAVISVNGNVVTSGVFTSPIALNDGPTVINLAVTAQDGVTVNTYSVTVNRTGSNNVKALLALNPSTRLTAATTGPGDVNYTATVSEGQSTIRLIPTVYDNATVTVNGVAVTSGTASDAIALTPGDQTLITMVVTAEDGATTKTYTISVSRPSGILLVNKNDSQLLFANKPANNVAPTGDDGVVVHQGVSPNGDGSNDFLYIEGIDAYPGNKLSIMNTSGTLVFETRNYGANGSNLFDGHSNKNGALLKPGTYYYSLEYQVGKQSKRKTGYIVIKY